MTSGMTVALSNFHTDRLWERSYGRPHIYRRNNSFLRDLVVLRARLRSFVRGQYGTGIFDRINRVVSHHGLFDLRAALAGEILALRPARP